MQIIVSNWAELKMTAPMEVRQFLETMDDAIPLIAFCRGFLMMNPSFITGHKPSIERLVSLAEC